MKYLFRYFWVVLGLYPCTGFAQNLVPNPSFEDRDDCPYSWYNLTLPSVPTTTVQRWYTASTATPDYFACTGTFGVPVSMFGYQYSRTGDAHAGAYAKTTVSTYREYLEAKLQAPLTSGHTYYTSYWLNLALDHSDTFHTFSATDRMGAYFSDTPIERSGSTLPMDDLIPQIVSPSGLIFADTLGWEKVSGMFSAAGGEEWITIGSFVPYIMLTVVDIAGNHLNTHIYYYYDDVCVMDLDGTPVASRLTDTSLCGVPSINCSGRASASEYLWNDGSTSLSKIITDSGVYWVKSIYSDSCIFYLDSFIISGQSSAEVIDLGEDTFLCSNTSIQLDAYHSKFDSYDWNTGDTTASITVTDPGIYFVYASSACSSGSDTIVIYPAPVPSPLPKGIAACDESSIRIGIPTPGISYLWSTGDTACCIDVTASGMYSLTATTACGDVFVDSVSVSFLNCDRCIEVPSAFSPNNDGLNDAFRVIAHCPVKHYRFSIYNRWGERVFTSLNSNDRWDGKVSGAAAESGVYYYYLEAWPEGSDKEIQKRGDITLLR